MNYYNEFDPKAGEWLKTLIEQKSIPDGVVDTRSIKDVRANDLLGFTQCHFFAGIGGWNYALKLAGVDPGEPLWTGSCPCQPYSQAGKNKGFKDERDLWPVWFELIKECRPAKVFGEQVERAIKHGWLDRVYTDMESENYACGSVVLGAHSVNAPHQRQRLYFGCISLSDSDSERRKRQSIPKERRTDLHEVAGDSDALRLSDTAKNGHNECNQRTGRTLSSCKQGRVFESAGTSDINSLAEDSTSRGCRRWNNGNKAGDNRKIQTPRLCTCGSDSLPNNISIRSKAGISRPLKRKKGNTGKLIDNCASHVRMDESKSFGLQESGEVATYTSETSSGSDRLANSVNIKHNPDRRRDEQKDSLSEVNRQAVLSGKPGGASNISSLPPWGDFVLVLCRDTDKNGNHKVRRVPAESILFGMADGLPEGMDFGGADRAFPLCQGSSFKKGQIAMLLKGYGNAINPYIAAKFVESFMDAIE